MAAVDTQVRVAFRTCRTLVPRWAAAVDSLRKPEARLWWSRETATPAEWRLYVKSNTRHTPVSRVPWTVQRRQAWRITRRALVICPTPFAYHLNRKLAADYQNAIMRNAIPRAEWEELALILGRIHDYVANLYIDFSNSWAQWPYPYAPPRWPAPLDVQSLAVATHEIAFDNQLARNALAALSAFEHHWHLHVKSQ